jgi:hypothetical protein
LLASAAVLTAIAFGHFQAISSSCDSASTLITACVSNSGTQVDIGATQTTHATRNTHHTSGHPHTVPSPAPIPTTPAGSCPLDRCNLPYDVVSPPDVTLADLASFRPARPSLDGEPQGFAVLGMPANLVAAASTQHIPGTILGWYVTVRFVPARFVFTYGDGGSATTSTGGASWERLGLAQFTPTATSHVYAHRGTFPVSVAVEYSASVDFGSGTWRPVAGYVTASTGGYDVQVVEVRTALVDRTCGENPRGPGC